ncbi:MAG: hypothetical protein A4C66_13990 [Nitrospira sp. HN-bin3]|uniref:hypothetical protein n=1 Tax=Nitrospira cf. moscoviensis SBR1015 TaxID=96242 RepID=UPI000A0B9C73|nr:hypothetical protein [Nitrospira cf. moscoviensis SBR1015]OQW51348.1 MAG: hypothetical protein A4C66_13990 [Nitrospira sp. HN-bin3]
MIPIKQSTASYPLLFFMTDSTDHITGKTGLSPTVTLSKNGGSFASPSGAVSEIASGWYKVAANATDSNTLGPLTLHATGTGADPFDGIVANIVAVDPYDAVRFGLSVLPNDARGLVLTSGTAAAIANGTITLASGHNLASATSYAVILTGGTNAIGKSRIISYSGSGDVFNVDPAWNASGETTPSGTITYVVVGYPPAPTTGIPDVNVTKVAGTTQTARDLGGNLDTTVSSRLATSALDLDGGGRVNLGKVLDTVQSAGDLSTLISQRATPAQILTTALTESYAADGAAGTLSQILFGLQAFLQEKSVSGTTLTVKKLDGSTTAMTFTLNHASNPTSVTRSG